MTENNEWFQWVLGGFVAVLAWLGKIVHSKASNAVSRAEFKEVMREWQEERREMQNERREMHAENKQTLASIHSRVDELYRDSYLGGGR